MRMKKTVYVISSVVMLLLTGCKAKEADVKMSSEEKASEKTDVEQKMKVYDRKEVENFLEHGSGALLIEGSEESISDSVAKQAEKYGVTISYYHLDGDEEDEDLIYLINSHNINRMKLLGDTIECPLLLFVEEGMIQSYLSADDLGGNGAESLIDQDMNDISEYLKQNEEDACDSGCKIG